jgi:hypothetical protein
VRGSSFRFSFLVARFPFSGRPEDAAEVDFGMTPIDSAMAARARCFGGNRIDVHEDTAPLLKMMASR